MLTFPTDNQPLLYHISVSLTLVSWQIALFILKFEESVLL